MTDVIYSTLRKHLFDVLAILACLLFGLAGTLVSLHRFWQYETFYYDFGIYDQAIWSVSRFQPPFIDHVAVGNKLIFADHLGPSLFLFSPIYWFTDKQEAMLIAQAVTVAVSGFFLYLIGKKVLKDKLTSLLVLCSYFLFVGLQNAVITDLHDATLMVLPLMLTFWAIVTGRKIIYFVFLIATLLFKESTSLLGIGIGICILFIAPSWRKIALLTMIISCLWGVLAIKVIIPHFSGGIYGYSPELPQTANIIPSFFNHETKVKTLFYSFLNFGFLPLLAPMFWPVLLGEFAIRFLPKFSETRWGLGLHYNAPTSVLLGVSSVYGLFFLMQKIPKKIVTLFGVFVVCIAIILYRFVLRGPFALAYNPAFYEHTKNFVFLNSLISKIPPHASVMTQNNLAPRFTHQTLYLLGTNYVHSKPDYILFDLRNGQNPNNFFPTNNLKLVIRAIRREPYYTLLYKTNEQYIYKRK